MRLIAEVLIVILTSASGDAGRYATKQHDDMTVPFLDIVESRQFARRFVTLLDTHLIWYKHYFPWADAVIHALDSPPLWVLEISTIKYLPDASSAVRAFAYSEPFEEFNQVTVSDEHVACMFQRQETGATSWATFLWDAGCHVDGNDGRKDCDYFFHMLNHLEDSEYNSQTLTEQRAHVHGDFAEVIGEIGSVHETFMIYFRRYVHSVA